MKERKKDRKTQRNKEGKKDRKTVCSALLSSLITYLLASVNRALCEVDFFFPRAIGFGNVFAFNLNENICKPRHCFSRQGQLVRQPRYTQSVKEHTVSSVQCSMCSGFILSSRSFQNHCK